MNSHVPFDACQPWGNTYGSNCSNDPLVDKLIGNAYHVVRTVYCNLGNLKLIFDFLNQYGMVLGVQSETELKAMTTSASYVRLYGFDNTNKRVVTDYLYVEDDRTGVIPDDPNATGSWILVATSNSGGGGDDDDGKAAPLYIPYTYNNGSAIGGETTIPVPAGTVGVPMIVVEGYTNLVGYGFTYDASSLTVTLSQALEPGDEVHLLLTGTPAVPDNPNISNWVTINWLYNGGYAVGGEQVIAIPYTFEAIPAIYKNGERYYAGLADKSYTVDAANQRILLTEPLATNDRLIVQIGGESTTFIMSDRTVQEVARSANVHENDVILSTNTTQYLNGMKVVYDVVAQKIYGLPTLPINVYINSVSNGQLTYSPGNITVDLEPVPESGSDVFNQLSQPDGYTLIPSIAAQANSAQIAEWKVLGDVRGWGAKLDGSDDSSALQTALSEAMQVTIPHGATLYVGSTVITPKDFMLSSKQAILEGAPGITILQLPQYNGVVTGSTVDGIHFTGSGCTGIGVQTPSTSDSGYYRYVPRLSVHNCQFYWELAYGIDGNLIFADIFNCSFGYLGVAGASKTLSGIRSRASDLPGAVENPNFNKIRKCYFYNGTGAQTHINFYRGGQLVIEDCDFEQAGQCISLDACYHIDIKNCWFESCSGAEGIIKITNCATVARIFMSKLYRSQGADGGTITYDSTNVNRLEVSYCDFEQQSGYPLFNKALAGTSAAVKVPPQNTVVWYDNRVINAGAGNAYTSTYNYKGKGTPRAVVRYNMATSTIINSSVPVTLTKQATGSFTLTFTDMLGVTATNQLGISVTAYDAYVRIGDGGGSNNNQILVNVYKGDTHVLFDSTDVTLVIY